MFDSNDNLAKNKLIILYLLKKMDMPVSLAHIQNFALSVDMNYFSLSQYLADMLKVKQIRRFRENNQTFYIITKDGIETLSYFENLVTPEIKEDIRNYVKVNKPNLKDELDVKASYTQAKDGTYNVSLNIAENSDSMLDLTINAVSKQQAKKICSNWKNNTSHLYLSILRLLLNSEQPKN